MKKHYANYRLFSIKQYFIALAILSIATLLHVDNANAIPVLLEDGNTRLTYDPQSPSGLSQWEVDGKNYMKKSMIWYRVGNTPEQSLDTLTLITANASDSNAFVDNRNDVLNMVLDDSAGRFRMHVKYMIMGGLNTSGRSDMTYDIRVDNLTNAPLDFSLFLSQDLDISFMHGDNLSIQNGNTSIQSDINNKGQVQHALLSPTTFSADSAITIQSTLSDANADFLNGQISATPGDVAAAWQWDLTIAPDESLLVGGTAHMELSQVVPAPGSLALLGTSVFLMLRRRKHTN